MPATLHRHAYESPIGPLMMLASADGLCALEFVSERRHVRLVRRLDQWFAPYVIDDGGSPVLAAAERWLREYFAGGLADAGPIALDLRGTVFERRVWACLLQIPPGTTFTYGGIAGRLGIEGGARAVGLAVGSNPVSLIVPCHRVVGAHGALTGYGGGLDRKKWLLEHERTWNGRRPGRLF